jgi:hypothetical protein
MPKEVKEGKKKFCNKCKKEKYVHFFTESEWNKGPLTSRRLCRMCRKLQNDVETKRKKIRSVPGLAFGDFSLHRERPQ